MNKPIKCPHCNKVFFDSGNKTCPFCKKELIMIPDFLKDIFNTGENND